jgi:uncharacterized protein involved in exopolysaccharide biosynthesis
LIQQRDTFADEEINLREYLLVLVRKWWVVGGVFVFTVGATWAVTSLFPKGSEYEARTKLLIMAPLTERLLGQREQGQKQPLSNPFGGTSLSVETLSALATANDLLQRIIGELDLKDTNTGRPWAVETLAGMMKPKVETAGRGSAQAALPLLTMTIRGEDPGLLRRIADKWAGVFVEKNSQLFTTESARSYDFILAQYKETQTGLRKLGEERAQFIAENPLALLQDELEIKRSDLKQYQDTFLDLSAQLALKREQHKEALTHQNELTVDGRWIGLADRSTANPRAVASTPEQTAVLQTKERLFEVQERIRNFQETAGLALLKQRRSHLLDDHFGVGFVTERGLLGKYTSQLEEAENNVRAQSRTLEVLESEFKLVPQFLVGSKTEAVNPIYTGLADRIIATRTSIETERERVNLLKRRVEATRSDVKNLEKEITEKEGIQLPRLQNELALAQAAYKEEQTAYTNLQEQAVSLRNDVRKTQALRDEYQKLVNAYQADVNGLRKRIAAAELRTREFDRENAALETTFNVLAERLQGARIAKGEQAASIRVVEAAVEPQVPVGVGGRRNVLLLSAVLGLLLGVVLVFLVHYLQGPEPPRRESPPPAAGVSVGQG